MSNILVTGGAGNIGSALVRRLVLENDVNIVIADNLLTGSSSKIPTNQRVKFIKADVNDYNDISAIFYTYKFDYVFHFAAVVGVQRTLDNPLWVLNDIKGIENVLKLCKNTGVKRVYYSSSSEVYGEPVEFPQNEHTTPLNSRLPYAIVKNIGEAYFKSYYNEFGLEHIIFRFFNTYGPMQSEDFVIPRFIRKALNNQDLALNGDGLQTRTFLYVDDNIETCLNAHKSDKFVNEIINIGGSDEVTIRDLAQLIIDITNSKSKIINLPPLKEGDMTRRKPDVTKMMMLLDRPCLSLEAGIKRLIQFYQNENRS